MANEFKARNGVITPFLQSTVSTGTAPLTVTSTTAVTNLNADLLDGNHASAFYLATNPSGYTSNTGTVTSVSGTGTVSGLSLSGTVTTSGNITLGGTLSVTPSNFASQTANTFLAAPNGTAGTPSFRAIVAEDIPTLNQNTTGTASNVTGTVAVANGGTGATTLAANSVILGNGTSAVQTVAPGTNGNVLTSNGTTWVSSPPAALGSWQKKTTTYTLVAGDRIVADTSGGSWTITLPATPSTGHSVIVSDGANWTTNNLTVARNGSTIEGVAEDLVLDIRGIQVEFIYSGTTWEVFAFTGPAGTQVNDNVSSANTVYPVWAASSSGFQLINASSTKLYFTPSTGQLNATDFNSLSDANLKTNVADISEARKVIDSLRPVSFDWKDTGQHSFGLIAQEVEQVLPNVVNTNSDTGIKSVSYSQIIPFLIAEIQELRRELESLKEKQ